MNVFPEGSGARGTRRALVRPPRPFLAAILLPLFLAAGPVPHLAAQATIKTLAGGPLVGGGPANGYTDGSALESAQFSTPSGLALDRGGRVYLADRDNGRIRIVDVQGNRVSTFIAGLNQPVDLVTDATTNLFVLTAGDGALTQFDRFGNPMAIWATGLQSPAALALDLSNRVYVVELGGRLQRFDRPGLSTTLLTNLAQPRGVEVLDTGWLAISEAGTHSIRTFDPKTQRLLLLSGGNGAGFRDGDNRFAQFNNPGHLAQAPNGLLVVADAGNQRFRLVDPSGVATTLYGTNAASWVSNFPGWEDGSVLVAEARDPSGVVVSPEGTVYTTESYYHLLRSVTGATLSGSSGTGGGTRSLPLPSFSPTSGYFPLGQTITVTSVVARLHYTQDGTEPTTNSPSVSLLNDVGRILWRNSLRDLRSLRFKAFEGSNASLSISGNASATNEIGITRDVTAGPGSTAFIPITTNLRPDDEVRSLQFRVEISPEGTAPMILDTFRAVPISTNDFIPVVTSASANPGGSTYSTYAYSVGKTRGLGVAFIGTNANYQVKDYAVVSMLAVPIPPNAKAGDRYRLDLVQVSATRDAQQDAVPLSLMPSRSLVVAPNVGFLVGDSSPSVWYNAELADQAGDYGFGDFILQNSDVNNVFLASFGLRVPYPDSDLFSTMDAYPEDVPGRTGGDGQIRFLDWQVLLSRSLRLDTNNWRRFWGTSGSLQTVASNPRSGFQPAGLRPATVQTASVPPGAVWVTQATLSAASADRVEPGMILSLPLDVSLAQGATLSGLQFRVRVSPEGEAPPLREAVHFDPAIGIPAPLTVDGLPASETGGAWSLFSNPFSPALQGQTRLGSVTFRVPPTARAGHRYTIRFDHADGSPFPMADYRVESLPSTVLVLAQASTASVAVSDEWRVRFFGSLAAADAAPDADPDHDGVPNWAEFQAGTDPTRPDSRLEVRIERSTGSDGQSRTRLRWLSAPGKTYNLEQSDNLNQWSQTASAVAGTGFEVAVELTGPSAEARYYRIRLVTDLPRQ